MGDLLFLDDLAVGMRFATGTATLTREEIVEFAGRYDPQPFHLDDEAAKRSLFGGLAASGWNVMAVSMRLMVTSNWAAGGLIGAGVSIEWPRPTRPGDTLRVESEIVAITPSRSKPDRGMVTVRHETKNQRDEVVQLAVAKMLSFRRGAQAALD